VHCAVTYVSCGRLHVQAGNRAGHSALDSALRRAEVGGRPGCEGSVSPQAYDESPAGLAQRRPRSGAKLLPTTMTMLDSAASYHAKSFHADKRVHKINQREARVIAPTPSVIRQQCGKTGSCTKPITQASLPCEDSSRKVCSLGSCESTGRTWRSCSRRRRNGRRARRQSSRRRREQEGRRRERGRPPARHSEAAGAAQGAEAPHQVRRSMSFHRTASRRDQPGTSCRFSSAQSAEKHLLGTVASRLPCGMTALPQRHCISPSLVPSVGPTVLMLFFLKSQTSPHEAYETKRSHTGLMVTWFGRAEASCFVFRSDAILDFMLHNAWHHVLARDAEAEHSANFTLTLTLTLTWPSCHQGRGGGAQREPGAGGHQPRIQGADARPRDAGRVRELRRAPVRGGPAGDRPPPERGAVRYTARV